MKAFFKKFKKRDNRQPRSEGGAAGYVLIYVLVMVAIMSAAGAAVCSVAVRNYKSEVNAVARDQEVYSAEGLTEALRGYLESMELTAMYDDETATDDDGNTVYTYTWGIPEDDEDSGDTDESEDEAVYTAFETWSESGTGYEDKFNTGLREAVNLLGETLGVYAEGLSYSADGDSGSDDDSDSGETAGTVSLVFETDEDGNITYEYAEVSDELEPGPLGRTISKSSSGDTVTTITEVRNDIILSGTVTALYGDTEITADIELTVTVYIYETAAVTTTYSEVLSGGSDSTDDTDDSTDSSDDTDDTDDTDDSTDSGGTYEISTEVSYLPAECAAEGFRYTSFIIN